MKKSLFRACFAGPFCLCTAWLLTINGAIAQAPAEKQADGEKKVIVVDGKKVVVRDESTPIKGESKQQVKKLSPARQEALDKMRQQTKDQDGPMSPIADGTPRGGVPGACCDLFNGSCTIRDQMSCEAVGGNFRGDNTTCTSNPCPQPLNCPIDVPTTHFGLLPPDSAFDPFGTFVSDLDSTQLVQQGFFTSGGEITRIRWWGVEVNGSANCTRANNNFNITFYADAGQLGPSVPLSSPTPEVVRAYVGLTATRLPAGNYSFNGSQGSYNGQLLWEYSVVLPQRMAMLAGWISIQATTDGTPCNFRWMSSAFGPGELFVDGQQVVDQTGGIQDVAVCLSGDNPPVSGACCDDNVQGGSCQDNVGIFDCNDFSGGDHRFRVDTTCANLTPPCGAITGSCCVGGTCTVTTAPTCSSQGGTFISFEDCTPNICVGACCFGDGTCGEVLESECFNQNGQFFGNGSVCAQTACPGTGRCCFNSGTECEIRTQASCDTIGGSRWDEGITCASPCPVPPSNDQCESAIPIMCGETITVDNTVATSDPSDPPFACSGSATPAGFNTIWFTFMPSASSATIRTCNGFAPADDSILAVYEGTCGAFTQIACDDDSCTGTLGLLSTVCVTNLTIGNTYYIEVASWDAASVGPYALEVICPGETCASTGSCCLPNGGCTVVSEPDCQGQGGTYNGDSTVCNALGACCSGPNSCIVSSSECCVAAGGAFLGVGTECGDFASVSSSPNSPITDNNTTTDSLTFTTSVNILDVNLQLDILHTFLGDLEIDLIHDAVTVRVMADQCGSSDNMMITFDDEAGGVIACGAAGQPTNGTFIPQNPLSAFDSMNSAGTWTLNVFDDAGADQGTLVSWAVIIEYEGINPCNPTPGACCFSEGTGDCQSLSAIDCALAGGRYQGPDTTCTGDICIPRGACCDTITGGCQQLTQEACQALPNKNFLGDFTACGQCPIILGSCCLPSGECQANTTFDPCTAAGGQFAPGGNCDTVGACCFGDTSCLITTQACCIFAGGGYLNDGSNCGESAGNPTPYTNSPGLPINAANTTVIDTIVVGDFITIGDVNVHLNIPHTWIGDLIVDVSHNGTTVRIVDQPGFPVPDATFGCDQDNLNNIVLDDEGNGGPIEDQCVPNLSSPPSYTPNNPLSAFDGMNSGGDWTITIMDTFAGADDGTLTSWTVEIDGIGFNPCDTEPGACCFSEGVGDCQLLDAVNCAQAGGRFQGGGSACSGDICVPRGACCDTINGSCQQLTQEACQVLPNKNFLGDFTPCGQCPIILGSCCLPDLRCLANVQFNACNSQGGAFSPGGNCDTTGACCLGDSSCLVATQACCLNGGGAYLGDGTNCGDAAGNPTTYSATPALAIPDNAPAGVSNTINVVDSFTVGDVDIQLDVTHTFVGDLCVDITHSGTMVSVIQRIGSVGACAGAAVGCAENNLVNIVLDDEGTGGAIEDQCLVGGNLTSPPSYTPNNPLSAFDGTNSSGDWTITISDNAGIDVGTLNSWAVIIDGVGINPCDTDPGACCFSEGVGDCQLLDAVGCANAGGRFQGGGTACSGNRCVPRGACCNTVDGSCQQLTQEECQVLPNSNFLGDFTPCGQCPVILGSCCLGDLTCIPNTQFNACNSQGGAFTPGGNCDTTGACCLGDSSCLIATQACCLNGGGAYLGDGTNCGDAAGNPTTYSANPVLAIPDNAPAGVSNTINVADSYTVGDVNIQLDVTHTFVGDLCVDIIHSGTTVSIIQRAGVAGACTGTAGNGCAEDNWVNIVIDDEGTGGAIEAQCPVGGNLTSPPSYTPNNPLSAFDGTNSSGDWTITISDNAGIDTGTLNSWAVIIDGVGINPCDTDPGACCFSEGVGDCQLLDAVGCANAGGRFQGGGTACTGNVCVPRGACCNTLNGSCQQLTQEECQASPNGNFLGDFSSCGQCPIVTGACCLPNNSCQANAQFNPCTSLGGTFIPNVGCGDAAGDPDSYTSSPGLAIPDNPAPAVSDSINVPDSFSIGDLNLFIDITHTYLGDLEIDLIHDGVTVRVMDDLCASSDNMLITFDDEAGPIVCGAAGLPTNGTFKPLNPLTPFDGHTSSGQWTLMIKDDAGADTGTLNTWTLIIDGVGVNPCDQTPGACCLGETDQDCQSQTGADCATLGGRYQGPGTTCTPGLCIIRGACCNTIAGTCTLERPVDCAGANQAYQGDGTSCETVVCPAATGACCLGNGTCQNGRTLAQCTTSGGNWEGANTTCETVTGACCMGVEDCLITSSACCTGLGGTYAGVGTNCGAASGNPTDYPVVYAPAVAIPDNNLTGVSRIFTVPDSFLIADVDVSLNITHQVVSQLIVRITHNGVTKTIVNRIGIPTTAQGCLQSNLNVRIDDEGTGGLIENGCAGGLSTNFPTSPPNFKPEATELLSAFDNMDASGDWTITVVDAAVGANNGVINGWTLHIDGYSGGACSTTDQCLTCPGDMNGDNLLDGRDVRGMSDCLRGLSGNCPCGDMNADTQVNMSDVPGFVAAVLQGTGSCGGAPICATCTGDSNGDGTLNGSDCKAFVDCMMNSPSSCPCSDMNGDNVVDNDDVADFVTKVLSTTGACP